jgi:hypothetical protein
MTSDTLQEPEFFGAAAVIAGTLWAITTVLFSVITGGIVRSGLLGRVGIDLVLLVSSALIITISNLFLVGMVVALSMLMPPGPRAQHMRTSLKPWRCCLSVAHSYSSGSAIGKRPASAWGRIRGGC